uniref:Cadherin-1 n=1 Tax=Tetraodon nigroviridis TaxID=99883 RepID=H3BYY6_TETNG
MGLFIRRFSGEIVFLKLLSVSWEFVTPEEQTCVPGFKQSTFILKVTSKHLRQQVSLGKVNFEDCTDRTRFSFSSSDGRVRAQADGALTVKRPITLHEGHLDFLIHIWDSRGRKHTLPVRLLHQERQREAGMEAQVPVVYFHKSGEGLKRRKRDMVIPPLNVPENHRGPYPLKISQIRSNKDDTTRIYYSISGPGANQPPVNLFTMDRVSGTLFVTQQLDREQQASYMLKAYAVAEGSGTAEEPMDIIVNVIDQNDNKPAFVKDTFLGEVPEASPTNFEVIQVNATDLDEPNSYNSDIRYKILSQEPKLPSDNLFTINPTTGVIRVNAGGLDREKYPEYTLEVQAADLEGIGLTGVAKVILTVTDSNDNAPAFTQASYETSVAENKADSQILRMLVTDGDEPHSAAWNAKFTIVSGDPGGFFSVKTGTNKQEGILSTAKGLDFEKNSKHTLLIAVENEVPFAVALPTATATVVVTVQDVNEAPIFDPPEKQVSKGEDLPVGTDVVQYTASDPDTARKQKVMYRILNDPAGWLNVDKETGVIKVKTSMDRESLFVKDNKYTALIGAYDDDEVPATGTGTLMVLLEDVNDNAPVIEERAFQVCRNKPAPQLLSVTDKDGPGNGAPFSVSLQDPSRSNWTARMNDSIETGIILQLTKALESGQYTVVLRVADNRGRDQDNTVQATVCECTGEDNQCQERVAAGTNLPVILGVLAGILLLLMLVLLLLMFARRRRGPQKEPLLQDTDTRDNIFYYDEEGGGEDDQDYDLSVLHRGLDNRPEVFRNDVMPNFMPAPQYQPRPANPEEIGNFIDNNLKTADNDPTAPPYDSLLVFDYEGGGSDSGSLSSLNSSSSGDQDYDCLSQWGPRFKKLADMYGGGEDD